MGLSKSGLNFLTYIAKKNHIHINNLNLFKEAAHEKTLEVLDLYLVKTFALFLLEVWP